MAFTRENMEPNGTIKGTIEMVDGFHKVTFVHEGCDYVLGLFSTVDEAHRVCDVLNIKEAVDARQDLLALRLHFDLGRYGVDNDTAGEIRSVSFRQVVRDLQVCAVHPINGAIGPEETQASSWAYAGATGILTSGTRFTDAVEHQPGEGPEGGPCGAASAAGPRACGGAAHLPRRHGRPRPGRSAAASPAPSAALAAFTAAGIANAAAAAAEHPPPPASPATGRPLNPPQKFGDAPAQQGELAGQTQQGQQEQQQEQAHAGQVTEQQHDQQEQREHGNGLDGQQLANSQEMPGRRDGRAAPGSPGSAHKRLRGAGEEAQRRGQEGRHSRGSGGSDSPPVSAGAAAAALAAAGAAANAMQDDDDGLFDSAAAAGAAGAGEEPQQPQQEGEQPGEAAAPGRGARRKPGRSPGTGAKRARRQLADGPAQRPWQEQDVLAFTLDDHPFHGITRLPDGCVAAQLTLKLLDGRVMEGAYSKLKPVRFGKCTTPAEAAAAWDVASLWRAIQYGRDPASLDAHAEASQRLNFDFSRYADMLPQLRRRATHTDLQAFVNSLRDNGTLALLATNGQQRRAASPQAAAAAAPAAPAGAARSPSTTPAPAPAPPAGGPPVRSLSGFHGVHGSGPWAAQLKAAVDKVVPEQQAAWTSRHREHTLKVARCASAELAAACHDLLLLWRCTLYGEDPAGPAGAALNFPLAALAAFQAALPALSTDTVVPHIVGLRDSGELQRVVSRRASPPGVPAAGAAPPAAAAAAKPTAKRRSAAPPAARQAAAKRAAVGHASSPARSPPVPPPVAAEAAPAAEEEPAAVEAAPAAQATAPAATEAAPAAAAAAATEAAPAAVEAAGVEAAPAAVEAAGGEAAPAAQAAAAAATEAAPAGAEAAGAEAAAAAAAEAAEAPAEAAGAAAGAALPTALGAGQQQGRLDEAPREPARYDGMCSPDELAQVEAAEAAFADVQARLSAVPQLSQLDVVAYMAHFMRLRDMRRLMHQQVISWSEAGEQALIVQHVRALLGRL